MLIKFQMYTIRKTCQNQCRKLFFPSACSLIFQNSLVWMWVATRWLLFMVCVLYRCFGLSWFTLVSWSTKYQVRHKYLGNYFALLSNYNQRSFLIIQFFYWKIKFSLLEMWKFSSKKRENCFVTILFTQRGKLHFVSFFLFYKFLCEEASHVAHNIAEIF